MMLLIINVIFGVVYGAYTLFWMPETLPRYYDENHVCNFAQGAFHMHIPGVYYNNRNWLHVLKCNAGVVRGKYAPDTALHGSGGRCLNSATGWQVWGAVLIVIHSHRCLAQSSSRQRSINDRIAQGERKRSLLLLTAM